MHGRPQPLRSAHESVRVVRKGVPVAPQVGSDLGRGALLLGRVPTSKVAPVDRALEQSIRSLLSSRALDATICPSDAARAVGGESWRELMEPARRAARRLVEAGEVVITQRGVVVDPTAARGPIRIRRQGAPQ